MAHFYKLHLLGVFVSAVLCAACTEKTAHDSVDANLLLYRAGPEITLYKNDIASATYAKNADGGGASLEIVFTAEGAHTLQTFTQAAVGHEIATLLNGRIFNDSTKVQTPISGGAVTIGVADDDAEAKNFVSHVMDDTTASNAPLFGAFIHYSRTPLDINTTDTEWPENGAVLNLPDERASRLHEIENSTAGASWLLAFEGKIVARGDVTLSDSKLIVKDVDDSVLSAWRSHAAQ